MKNQYDSEAEKKAGESLILAMGYRRVGKYENISAFLFDPDGIPYKAKLDFIPILHDMCTVEFKTTDMNSRKSKPASEKALAAAEKAFFQYGQGGKIEYVRQLHSWSNSVYKHGEQHAKLPPLSHITVFSYWPTHKAIKKYLKLGILFCHISGLDMLNGLCTCVRNGFGASFSFATPDGQYVSYDLMAMYQHQLANYTNRDPGKPATNMAWTYKRHTKEWKAAGF